MKMKDSERLANEFLLMQDGSIPEAIYLAEDLPEGDFKDEVINYLEAKLPPIKLICEHCGNRVREGQDIRATFHENGCDHYYQLPNDPRVAMFP